MAATKATTFSLQKNKGKNNSCNSNNATYNNKYGGGSRDIVFSINNSGGGNKNDLQVKLGTISKGCLVYSDEVHWQKDFQKGQVAI